MSIPNSDFHHGLLVDVYKDEGWSGGLLARPALDRLRDDAAKGRYRAVLINDVDRLARDVTHLGVLKRDLERHGVRVIFRKLPTESSPTQNLMINVLGSFAEFERELIADRTRRGRRHKVEVRREFLGCRPPYGFKYVAKNHATGEDGQLQLDPLETAVVREMYAWVDREGLSALEVGRRLTARGVPTRKGGSTWAKSTVLRVLRNETYVGVWHYYKHEKCIPLQPREAGPYRRSTKSSNRLRARADWIPLPLPEDLRIIPRDQWERVQLQLDRNRMFSPRNSRHTYLLKGLVRCGACGRRYVGQPSHGRFAYRCVQRCKRLPSISEERLNAAVWQAVAEALLNPSLILEQVERLRKARQEHAAAQAQMARQRQQALEQLATEEARILEAYRLNILSAEQLRRELDGIEHRRKTILPSATERSPAPMTDRELRMVVTDYCAFVAARLNTFTMAERQRVLQSLVREIWFEGDRVRIRAVVPIPPKGPVKVGSPGDPDRSEDSCERIATTTPYDCGRNHTRAIPFELVRPLPPVQCLVRGRQ